MKTKVFKRVLALALTSIMALTACGQKTNPVTSEYVKNTETSTVKESETGTEKEEAKEIPTITLFPVSANLFSGPVQGFRGDYFKENGFNLEVWAFSEEKYNTMLVSGELPDMMYVGSGKVQTLETLIESDMIINYDDYAEYLPHVLGDEVANEYITEFLDFSRENYSAGTGGLYALPFRTGLNSSYFKEFGTFDRNVPKLKWDVYEAIGAPQITDLWSLIDIAEQMLEYQPALEDGTKTYGTILDNGMDTAKWGATYLWYAWHGCNHNMVQYLVTANNIDGTLTPIFEEDGLYKEGVLWYHELYKRGLMDPDSISTPRNDQSPKVSNGLAMLPSGTLPGWADGYYEVFPSDVTVFFDYVAKTFDVQHSIVINKESEHLEECLKFVDMLADPFAWLNINYGPDGELWESNGNVLSITDEYASLLKNGGSMGDFVMPDGTNWATWNTSMLINTGTAIPGYVDINGDEVCSTVTVWPDAQAILNKTDNSTAWKETMNANNLWDYCEKNNITVYTESAFANLPNPSPDEELKLKIAAIKDVVVPATWQMVYADSDKELEEIWDKMVKDAYALGAQDVIDWMYEVYNPNK